MTNYEQMMAQHDHWKQEALDAIPGGLWELHCLENANACYDVAMGMSIEEAAQPYDDGRN